MDTRIPDLWKAKEDAYRLYALFLAHLASNNLPERIVSACRQIRRYAARGPGREAGFFTFDLEIDALCDLRQYGIAWRQLRLREEQINGKRFDLATHEWAGPERIDLEWSYAPLLFYLKRYRQGCSLLEISLDSWFQGDKVRSYEILFRVYNDDEEPSHRYRVTLSHFYACLGKDLREWRHWRPFINGLHPKLFRLVGVSRDAMLADSGQLGSFFRKLISIRDERTPTGIGGSLSDLLESPGKVKKRQDAMRNKVGDSYQRSETGRGETGATLLRLFPEISRLPIPLFPSRIST